MQKGKHEINKKYMISVPTNCLSCKLGCQATADFMRKLKEHNLNRACLAGGAPGLCGSGKQRGSCLQAYVCFLNVMLICLALLVESTCVSLLALDGASVLERSSD